MTGTSGQRIKQLDILRFFAVFLVLGRHMVICPPETSVAFNFITTIWQRAGWFGVDLFFVLSGFLVSGLIFREFKESGTVRLGRFLVRRGFKIYPSFWLLIAATYLYSQLRGLEFSIDGFWSEILFIQNYNFQLWNHTWSLAVEEHFYLFLALVTFTLLKTRLKEPLSSLPKIFAFAALACFLMRFYMSLTYQYDFYEYFAPSHLRFDSLFFGVAIAYFWHFEDLGSHPVLEKYRKWIAVSGVILLIPIVVFPLESTPWMLSIGLTGAYLASGTILLTLLQTDIGNSAFVRGTSYLGKYSYSIYLWHMPVLIWGVNETGIAAASQWWTYVCFCIAVSFGVGVLLSNAVEYPLLHFRDRLFPAKNTRPIATALN